MQTSPTSPPGPRSCKPASDSPWHDIGSALRTQGVAVGSAGRPFVELAEFGRRRITVGGREARPRIGKSYELLAYLAAKPDASADRDELLEALFEGRQDPSARAYLRQAVHQLREALGEEIIEIADGRWAIAPGVSVASESLTFERQLAEAARFQGEERLRATLEALDVYDRGEYLPGQRGGWADQRQQELAEVTEARYQAGVLAFGAGRYDDSERLVRAVLKEEPLREAAWRLRMRIAAAVGDEDGVLRSYRGCEEALAEVRASPSASTHQLFERLRR